MRHEILSVLRPLAARCGVGGPFEATVSALRTAAVRTGLMPSPPAAAPAAPAAAAPPPEEKKMNPALRDDTGSEITELSRKYEERSVTQFLFDAKMIERQDLSIARAVHAFFAATDTYRDVDLASIARLVNEFRGVYVANPITMNIYGLNFSSGLMLFLMARCLGPDIVVESGVYKGQSSHFLAAACLQAPVHAFDPNLAEVVHRTAGATYHDCDWMNVDIQCAPGARGLCFFDDHQSQALRVVQAHGRGFRYLVFDDSWPIETVTGCGWPPLPSVDMVMDNPLEPGEVVRWAEMGKIWTFVYDEEMQQLCARARRLIKAAHEVPSLYRESGIAPKSALKFVELV